jgi:hypothetical protein
VLTPLVIIGFLFCRRGAFGVYALALGTTAGMAAEMLVLGAAVHCLGRKNGGNRELQSRLYGRSSLRSFPICCVGGCVAPVSPRLNYGTDIKITTII